MWNVAVNGCSPGERTAGANATVEITSLSGKVTFEASIAAPGASGAVTIVVGFVKPTCEPAEFVAFTPTSSVCPTSALVTVYDCAVAPPIRSQFFAFASQRCH